MSETEIPDKHMAWCPKCSKQTAYQTHDGRWDCSNGCNLDGFRECAYAGCGTLFLPTQSPALEPCCSSECYWAATPWYMKNKACTGVPDLWEIKWWHL